MENQYPKRELYKQEVVELVEQVVEICAKGNISFAMMFQLDKEGEEALLSGVTNYADDGLTVQMMDVIERVQRSLSGGCGELLPD